MSGVVGPVGDRCVQIVRLRDSRPGGRKPESRNPVHVIPYNTNREGGPQLRARQRFDCHFSPDDDDDDRDDDDDGEGEGS